MSKPLVIGAIVGVLGSVVPLEFVFLAVLVFGFFLFVRMLWPVWTSLRAYCTGAAAAIAVMTAAAYLPVKQLDGRVGPMHYDAMPLDRLSDRLTRDWQVYFHANSQRVVSFHVNRSMSRRAVLEKLADETNMELRIGTCGTGASLLSGGFPCFTRLEERPRRCLRRRLSAAGGVAPHTARAGSKSDEKRISKISAPVVVWPMQ